MTKYVIVSERVGTPGEPFTPDEGTNVQALLDAGFIKSSGKTATKTTATEE